MKLGLSSRSAATAWAHRHGLVHWGRHDLGKADYQSPWALPAAPAPGNPFTTMGTDRRMTILDALNGHHPFTTSPGD